MNTTPDFVNGGDTAPIKNVAACLAVVRSLQGRNPQQNNLGVFAGFSGYGKSVAALYTQNKTDAAYVEVSDTWTRKRLLQAILSELGRHKATGTLADMEDEVIGLLARNPKRPLIIDEADKLVDKNMIETVRMVAKKSNVPVLLIGEEYFPKKLAAAGDRYRDLVLVWGYAQPCDLDDVRVLARTFYGDLTIADDLLDRAREEGDGRVRRIGNTLHAIAEHARAEGVRQIDLAHYVGRAGYFSTSVVPERQRAAPQRKRVA